MKNGYSGDGRDQNKAVGGKTARRLSQSAKSEDRNRIPAADIGTADRMKQGRTGIDEQGSFLICLRVRYNKDL